MEGSSPENVRTLAGLDNPNVVAIHDYAELGDDGGLCLVMEKLNGHAVADVLARSGPFDLASAARVTLQAAHALGAGHARGVFHGDVSADNVLLVRRGGQDDFVMLLNFASETDLGDAVGALDFASPESIAGGVADDRGDIYALAMVTYAMVCGRPAFPFRERSDVVGPPPRPRELRPELPAAAEDALDRAMHPDPALRPVAVELFATTFSRAVLDTTAAVRAFSDGELDETSEVQRPSKLRGIALTPLPSTGEEFEATATGISIPEALRSVLLEGE